MLSNEKSGKNKVAISFDLRLVVAVLVLIIAGMLIAWKPWVSRTESGRTITVSGESKITAEPDEYTFQPSYELKDSSKDAALAALTKKSEEIVKKLKELGVASSKIQVNSDGYDYYYYNETSNDFTYTLRLTVKVSKGDLVQKVQDYLVSTTPTGQVSPQAEFSTTLRKSLESKARDEATRDARAKADQSAKNLGFKVSKVKSVTDGTGSFGSVSPMLMNGSDISAKVDVPESSSLVVQPGENDLTYSVTVVYYIR
jgi:uncharacterized protein YggE